MQAVGVRGILLEYWYYIYYYYTKECREKMENNDLQIIPKKIHYVWVGGGEKSEKVLACIESWKKFCPDYEIIEWNESNFNLDKSPLIRKALEIKNWALVSDMIRIIVLYEHGGIYLDTDVEVIKNLDPLLVNGFFTHFNSKHSLDVAIMGGVKGHKILEENTKFYQSKFSVELTNFMIVQVMGVLLDRHYGIKSNEKKYAGNHADGIRLYTREYLSPQHVVTGKIKLTENSLTIHRFTGSWVSKRKMKMYRIFLPIMRCIIFRPFVSLGSYMVPRKYKKQVRKLLKRYEAYNAENCSGDSVVAEE